MWLTTRQRWTLIFSVGGSWRLRLQGLGLRGLQGCRGRWADWCCHSDSCPITYDSGTQTVGIDTSGLVPTSRQVATSGTGLSGGGDLSADRTITLDPSALAADPAFAGVYGLLGGGGVTQQSPMVSGRVYQPITAGAGGLNAVPSEGIETSCFWSPSKSGTIDRLACNVAVAGTSGAVVRLGVRAWDSTTGLPGDVLVDGGTVNAETTGYKDVTISLAVEADKLYCLTATVQGGAGTRPSLSYRNGMFPILGSTATGGFYQTASKSSVTGALDNTGSFSLSGLRGRLSM
jgi:hypothetical protein